MVDKTTDATFEQDVLKASGPVVVDFWAEWCGPCRMIAPALEEISKSLNGKVKIVKLNVDENPGTAAKFGIMSIPTLMLFENGELASRQVGAAPGRSSSSGSPARCDLPAVAASFPKRRHGRARPGDPRLWRCVTKTWMPGTRPGMTMDAENAAYP